MQVLLKQINETPRPIAAVKPEVAIPLEVEALLTRMLAKNPKERPGDTGKLRDELDALRPSPTTRGKTVLMPEMVTTSTGTRQITDRFSENDKTPSPDDRTPSPDDRTPSPDDRTPSPDDRTPSPDDRTPSPDDRTPSPDDRTPSPDEVIASPRAVALPKADTPGPASPVVSPAPPDDDPDPYAEVFSHSASKPRLGSRDRGGIDREETTRTGRRRRGPFPRPAKVQAEPADFSADYSAWNRSRRLGLALLAGVALLALIGAYLLFYFDA
jgi:serine/threonine protein kinase